VSASVATRTDNSRLSADANLIGITAGVIKMPKVIFLRTEEIKLKNKINACKRWNKPLDDIARFWSYVDIRGLWDCWEWTGGLDSSGYGQFKFNGELVLAHRLAYELYYGPIPDGFQANHKCNNSKCRNPFHLYAGTQQENMDDKVRENRQAKGESQGSAKLTEQQVLEIRENKNNLSQRKLAKTYGVSQYAIQAILHKKTWKHLITERGV
jgi:DNA-binding transcriptional regulator YiaG